mmetsp:Transcript_115000/g.330328  ORF Transcript_115000/g.330328 Transcript_115000/m.330328 type:complete len:224 (-) Transcript_115000:1440-2111(-)
MRQLFVDAEAVRWWWRRRPVVPSLFDVGPMAESDNTWVCEPHRRWRAAFDGGRLRHAHDGLVGCEVDADAQVQALRALQLKVFLGDCGVRRMVGSLDLVEQLGELFVLHHELSGGGLVSLSVRPSSGARVLPGGGADNGPWQEDPAELLEGNLTVAVHVHAGDDLLDVTLRGVAWEAMLHELRAHHNRSYLIRAEHAVAVDVEYAAALPQKAAELRINEADAG